MAANPFAPIVPCHRVVKSDFTLGGYGGGLKAKHEILTREKRRHTINLEIPVGSKKLKVFPVETVLDKLSEAVISRRRLVGVGVEIMLE